MEHLTTGADERNDERCVGKTRRRGRNNQGSIRKRPNGTYEARISLPDGSRKSYYGKTQKEVNSLMIQALARQENGIPPIRDERLTVAQYLKDWLAGKQPPAVRPRTYRFYGQMLNMYVVPTLGRYRLTKLMPDAVQRCLNDLLRHGLQATTVRHVYSVLHNALHDAERIGVVQRNVTELVRPPKQTNQEERPVFTKEQVQRFLAAAEKDPHYTLFLLAIATGMRPGELLALRWQNIDLEKRMLHVRATLNVPEILKAALGDQPSSADVREQMIFPEPKTRRSRRQITLSLIAVEALLAHRAKQNEQRLAVGQAWDDLDLVFANQVGHPLRLGNVEGRHFHPLLSMAGLPQIRFYDLRHTATSLLIEEGQSFKTVSDRLGHTSVVLTLDRYAHVLPGMQQDAADAMDRILGYDKRHSKHA
jgi:integrase